MVTVKTRLPCHKFDVAIVGANGPSTRVSLQLAETGPSVVVLSRVSPARSYTVTV